MKMIALVCAMILTLGVTAFAAQDQTDYSWFHAHGFEDNDSFVDRYSEFEYTRSNPLGIGLDVIVYEFEGDLQSWGLDSVEVQQKVDFNNAEYSGYVVGKVNVWRPLKKLLGIR